MISSTGFYFCSVTMSLNSSQTGPNFKIPPPQCQMRIKSSFQRTMGCSLQAAVTKSLFCNLKWLLLSSRLQALCCPRSWSLRSKMRLPRCFESGGGGRKKRAQSPLTSANSSRVYILFLLCCCL